MRTLAAGLAALLLFTASPTLALKRTTVGEPLKDFALGTLDGQTLRLTENLGQKATLVVFWAGWSPRSGEALSDFQKLYEVHGPKDLQVIAVNVDHQDREEGEANEIASFAQEQGLAFPVVVDKDLTVFDAYGVIAVPSTLLADSQGTIVHLLEGYAYMTRFDFRDRILEQLGVLEEEPEEPEVEVGYQPKGTAARHYQMGMLLLRKKQNRRALKAFQKAVKEDPEYAEAHLRLAEIYADEGMKEEATEASARAAALGAAPDQTEANTADTDVPSETDAVPSSGPDVSDSRASAARYVRMGKLLLQTGKGSEAVKAFEKAIERDPEYPEAYLGLAEALEAEGKPGEAGQARSRAASLRTSHAEEDREADAQHDEDGSARD